MAIELLLLLGVHSTLGRLIKDTNAGGGFLELSRSFESFNRQTVQLKNTEEATTTYDKLFSRTGDTISTNTDPNGRVKVSTDLLSGAQVKNNPDGSTVSSRSAPDPQYGMQKPYESEYIFSTPNGVVQQINTSVTATFENAQDLSTLQTRTRATTVNGLTDYLEWNVATKSYNTTSAYGRVSSAFVDDMERPVRLSIGSYTPIDYMYNSIGEIESSTQGSRRTQYSYNSDGYLESVTNSLNQTVSYERDKAGRVLKQTLPDSRQIGFSYDSNGNLESITPPSKPTHSFIYNLINQMAEYLPPALGGGPLNTRYVYNLEKRLTQVQRPDGKNIDFNYNLAGELVSKSTSSRVLTNVYNPTTGLLEQRLDSLGPNITNTFDGPLLTSETLTGEISSSLSMTYNNDLQVSSYSLGTYTIGQYYDVDRLFTGDDFITLARNFNGEITGTTLNGNSDSYTYNNFGEVETYTSSHYNVTYTRDNLGRITNETGLMNGISFSRSYDYDLSGRLVYVNDGGSITNYNYDDNSNRAGGTYDDQDRLLVLGNFTYTYTNNGELLTKTDTSNSQITHYQYDEYGNLRQASDGTNTINYVIDARNRRVGKRINGVLQQGFVYKDQLNPIAELDENNNIKHVFLYGSKPNVPDYMLDTSGVVYRIISNHLGSVKLVVNTSDNQVMQQLDYDVWGNITNDTSPGFQPFGFAGGIYDRHTGLTRFGVRDYDPVAARWTAKDPILFNGDGPNFYQYTLSDPVNNIDQNGENITIGGVVGVILVWAGRRLAVNIISRFIGKEGELGGDDMPPPPSRPPICNPEFQSCVLEPPQLEPPRYEPDICR